MDPLSALGTVSAIGQLTVYGLSFIRTLQRFARHATAAREEVDRLVTQIRSFSHIVGTAHASLSRHCFEYPQSPALTYMSAHRILDDLEQESKFVLKGLKDAKSEVKDIDHGWTIWMRVKWALKRDIILSLFPEMESVKNSLAVLMNTVQIEVLVAKLDNLKSESPHGANDLKAEIHLVKEMMQDQIDTIRNLERDIRRYHSRYQIPSNYSNSTQYFGSRSKEAFYNLGMSMIENDEVPRTPQSSRFSYDQASISTNSTYSHRSFQPELSNPSENPTRSEISSSNPSIKDLCPYCGKIHNRPQSSISQLS